MGITGAEFREMTPLMFTARMERHHARQKLDERVRLERERAAYVRAGTVAAFLAATNGQKVTPDEVFPQIDAIDRALLEFVSEDERVHIAERRLRRLMEG